MHDTIVVKSKTTIQLPAAVVARLAKRALANLPRKKTWPHGELEPVSTHHNKWPLQVLLEAAEAQAEHTQPTDPHTMFVTVDDWQLLKPKEAEGVKEDEPERHDAKKFTALEQAQARISMLESQVRGLLAREGGGEGQ